MSERAFRDMMMISTHDEKVNITAKCSVGKRRKKVKNAIVEEIATAVVCDLSLIVRLWDLRLKLKYPTWGSF